MVKKEFILFVSFLPVVLLILILSLTQLGLVHAPPAGCEWIKSGNSVHCEDSNVVFNITPHTLSSSGWVEFEVTSKQFTGEIDAVWGFNVSNIRPSRAEFYNPKNVKYNISESKTFYNVSSFAVSSLPCDFGNEYNLVKREGTYLTINNGTGEYQTNVSIVCYDSFDSLGNDDYTLRWRTENTRFQEWHDITNYQAINYDFADMNKWFALRKVNVQAGTKNRLRIFMEVIPSLTGKEEKYVFAMKLSSDTIQQAISNNRFYYLDPWFNSDYGVKRQINITNHNTTHSFGNISIRIIFNSSNINYTLTNDDGSDIRFLNSSETGVLHHYIDEWDESGDSIVWVNILNFPADKNTTIYVYYNNTGATTTSDIDKTFHYGDDFETDKGWPDAAVGGVTCNIGLSRNRLNITVFDVVGGASLICSASTQVNVSSNESYWLQFDQAFYNIDTTRRNDFFQGLHTVQSGNWQVGGNSGTGFVLRENPDGQSLVNKTLVAQSIHPIFDATIDTNYTYHLNRSSESVTGAIVGQGQTTRVITGHNASYILFSRIGGGSPFQDQGILMGYVDNLFLAKVPQPMPLITIYEEEIENTPPSFNSNPTFPSSPIFEDVFWIHANLTDANGDHVNVSFTITYPNGSFARDVDGNLMRRRNGTFISFSNNISVWNSSRVGINRTFCHSPGADCVGTWNMNITAIDNNTLPLTNFATNSFEITDTQIPLTVVVQPNTSTISGSSTPQVVNIRLNLSDNIELNTCHYNVSRQDGSYLVDITTINCRGNLTILDWEGTFSITDDSDEIYTFNLWANDSQNNVNVSSSTFTWDFTAVVGGGGGGGGGPAERPKLKECITDEENWVVKPGFGRRAIFPESSDILDYEITNKGTEVLTIDSISCSDQELNATEGTCQFVTLSVEELEIEPSTLLPGKITAKVDLAQSNLTFGDIVFYTIIFEDLESCRLPIATQIIVTRTNLNIMEKFAFEFDLFGIGIPYGLIFILLTISLMILAFILLTIVPILNVPFLVPRLVLSILPSLALSYLILVFI